jgi:hypothetical protein
MKFVTGMIVSVAGGRETHTVIDAIASWMDAVNGSVTIRSMPLPASSIDKLSDHSGAYVICVKCYECRHEREIDPRSLANILGWNSTLRQACTRLRCSKCQSRKFRVEIAFNRRPRGWRANPS